MTPAPKRRWLRWSLWTLALGAIALVVAASSTPLRIKYHEWQMKRALDDTYGKPPDAHHLGLSGYTLGESYERYVVHRQRLVALGAIRELHFHMRHMTRPTDASREFAEILLRKACPAYIDFESLWSDKAEPMELTVWCVPSDVQKWDEFIAEHDIAAVTKPES